MLLDSLMWATEPHLRETADAILAIPGASAPAVPDPVPSEIPGLAPVVNNFIAWGKWGLRIAGVLGLLICGGMMILGRRNRSSTAVDGATGIPWVLGGVSIASVAAALVGAVL